MGLDGPGPTSMPCSRATMASGWLAALSLGGVLRLLRVGCAAVGCSGGGVMPMNARHSTKSSRGVRPLQWPRERCERPGLDAGCGGRRRTSMSLQTQSHHGQERVIPRLFFTGPAVAHPGLAARQRARIFHDGMMPYQLCDDEVTQKPLGHRKLRSCPRWGPRTVWPWLDDASQP